MKSVVLIFVFQIFFGSTYNTSHIRGLHPLSSECEIVQRAFDHMIFSPDQCAFISMEHIDCPLTSSVHPIVTVTLEAMFNGFVSKYQKEQYCEIVGVFVKDFTLFRQFIRNKSFKNVFLPYTRVGIISTHFDSFEGIVDSEIHQQEILLGALNVVLGRIVHHSQYQMKDVLTNEIITYSNLHELASYVNNRKKNHLLYPLFGKNVTQREFRISLFHCPPYVIKMDDKMTLDR